MSWAYLDGRFLPEDEATVPATVPGVPTGRGVFETFRLKRGRRVFRFGRHAARLTEGARVLGIRLAKDERELADAAAALAERNGLEDARIRLTVLAKTACEDGFEGSVLMQARAADDYPEEMYRDGVSAVIATVRRDEASPLSRIKSTNRIVEESARTEARRRGAFEGVLLNTSGAVAEGSMTNVFIVRHGRIMTPPMSDGALPGITRDVLLRLTSGTPAPISESSFGADDLAGADEAFLTNAVAGVLPLVRLGEAPIGDGAPGPVTLSIREMYAAAADRET